MKTSLKTEFAFFEILSRDFSFTQFVNCRRICLELGSQTLYPSSKEKGKFVVLCPGPRFITDVSRRGRVVDVDVMSQMEWEPLFCSQNQLSFDAIFSSFSLAESPPRDLQITAYK